MTRKKTAFSLKLGNFNIKLHKEKLSQTQCLYFLTLKRDNILQKAGFCTHKKCEIVKINKLTLFKLLSIFSIVVRAQSTRYTLDKILVYCLFLL